MVKILGKRCINLLSAWRHVTSAVEQDQNPDPENIAANDRRVQSNEWQTNGGLPRSQRILMMDAGHFVLERWVVIMLFIAGK
jgi:hypothetical protein